MGSRRAAQTPLRLQLAMLAMSVAAAGTLVALLADLANGDAGLYRVDAGRSELLQPPVWPYGLLALSVARMTAVFFAFRHRRLRLVLAVVVGLAIIDLVDWTQGGSWSGVTLSVATVGLVVASRRVFVDEAAAVVRS